MRSFSGQPGEYFDLRAPVATYCNGLEMSVILSIDGDDTQSFRAEKEGVHRNDERRLLHGKLQMNLCVGPGQKFMLAVGNIDFHQ